MLLLRNTNTSYPKYFADRLYKYVKFLSMCYLVSCTSFIYVCTYTYTYIIKVENLGTDKNHCSHPSSFISLKKKRILYNAAHLK